MATIVYVHWNEQELGERIAPLTAVGYQVNGHCRTAATAKISEPYSDAVVPSPDRLPSHSRAIAEWLVEAKKRQHIPIILEGGGADKVRATQAKSPRATSCPTGGVASALEALGIAP